MAVVPMVAHRSFGRFRQAHTRLDAPPFSLSHHPFSRIARGVWVDLLATDVGLPSGMNGRQVADAAREHRPGLPVLFMTGYAGGALGAALPAGMVVIDKPFALQDLAERVGAMLDAARSDR